MYLAPTKAKRQPIPAPSVARCRMSHGLPLSCFILYIYIQPGLIS